MIDYYQDYVNYYSLNNYEIPYRNDCPKIYLNSTFDKFLGSMVLNLFENNEYSTKEDRDKILKERLYNKNSEIFKLNLFPIAKKDVSWDKNFLSKFQISKKEYYGKMFENRKKFIRKITKKFNPKYIICFATKEYSNYFEETFFEKCEFINYMFDSIILNNGKVCKIKIHQNNNQKMITIPFLGRGNLASLEDVRIVTNYLKENYLN